MNQATSACPTPETLREFTQGRLSTDETDRLAQHLEDCQACQQQIESLDGDSASIDWLRNRDTDLDFADEAQCGRLIDRITASKLQTAAMPARMGDYELQEKIGQGGMGTVYRAKHQTLGTVAAVKVLQSHREVDLKTVKRFEREMVALGRLDHPNIVRALDAGDEAGNHFLVMQFVDGIDFGRLVVAQGRLSVADACEVARQAALGLGYVHRNGRVHRDVKPSNLMLSSDGTVKLLDLGLARVEEFIVDETPGDSDDILGGSTVDLTRSHQVMGTLEYMPPEQANDSHSVDHRADLYSLGCTLFKLLTGQSPFGDRKSISAFSQLAAHLQSPPPPVQKLREDVPAALSDLISQMLAKDPEQRPPSADSIADSLGPFAENADLPALAVAVARLPSSVSATTPTILEASTLPIPSSGSSDTKAVRSATHQVRSRGSSGAYVPKVAALASVLGIAVLVVGAILFKPHWFQSRGAILVQAESPVVHDLIDQGKALLRHNGETIPMTIGSMEFPVGDYELVAEADAGLVFSPETFRLRRNQQVVISVRKKVAPSQEATPDPMEQDGEEIVEAGKKTDPKRKSIDLLKLVDPIRDSRVDAWKLVDGALESNLLQSGKIQFPYQPGDNYRIDLVAKRLEKGETLFFTLPVGGRRVYLVMDSYPPKGYLSGVNVIDGRRMNERTNDVHVGQVLPLRQSVPIRVDVRLLGSTLSIKLEVSGKVVTSWRGPLTAASFRQGLGPPNPQALILISSESSFRVSGFQITPMDDEGKIVEFTDPADDPILAAAQRVLWKGGTVSVVDDSAAPTITPPSPVGGFKLTREFTGHTGPVKTVELSPDARLAASGSGYPSGDKTVRIWDMATGECLQVIDAGMNVMHVTFSRDGKSLLASGVSPVLKRFDVQSGKLLQRYVPSERYSKYEEIAFTHDGTKILALAGRQGCLFVIDAETEEVLLKKIVPETALSFDTTPDDQQLVIGLWNGDVAVCDLNSGDEFRRMDRAPQYIGNIYSLRVSPEGTRVMAGYSRHRVMLWDLQSGNLIREFLSPSNSHQFVQFVPGKKQAVVGALGEGVASLVDLDTGLILGTTPIDSGGGWAGVVTPDGRSVLIANGNRTSTLDDLDYTLRLWELGVAPQETNQAELPKVYTRPIRNRSELPDRPQIVSIDFNGEVWFRDEDAEFLSNLSDVVELTVDRTALTGVGLSKIGPLNNLRLLSARDTKATTFPVELGASNPKLRSLDLSGSPISDLPNNAFEAFDALESINLSRTSIADADLESLSLAKSLKEVNLANTDITSESITSITKIKGLVKLNLSNTKIDELSQLETASLPDLRQLNLMGTAVSKAELNRLTLAMPDVQILDEYGVVDVLPLIDLERDVLNPGWAMEGAALRTSVAMRPGQFVNSSIALPIFLPQEFELQCRVTRKGGSHSPVIHLPLPDGTQFVVGFDQWPTEGGYTILGGIDGKKGKESEVFHNGVSLPALLNQSSQLKIRVEGTGDDIHVSVFVNDREHISWQGDRYRMRLPVRQDSSHPLLPIIAVFADKTDLTIDELTVTPIRGKTEFFRGELSIGEAVDREVAEWTIGNGGAVTASESGLWSDSRRYDSIEDLPGNPFRVVEVKMLEGVEISAEWFKKIAQLSYLTQLVIPDCTFENRDLAGLCSSPKLEGIFMSRSSLDDNGIRLLRQVRNFSAFSIVDTQVTIKGFAILEGDERITAAYIGDDSMSEDVVSIVRTLPSLQRLGVSSIAITGTGLAQLRTMRSLIMMRLGNTSKLNVEDLAVSSAWPKLASLELSNGSLGPDAIAQLATITSLQTLKMPNQNLEGIRVDELSKCPALAELDLSGNRLADVDVNGISELSHLQILRIAENSGVSDDAIESLVRLTELKELSIEGTGITAHGVSRIETLLPGCQVSSSEPAQRSETDSGTNDKNEEVLKGKESAGRER